MKSRHRKLLSIKPPPQVASHFSGWAGPRRIAGLSTAEGQQSSPLPGGGNVIRAPAAGDPLCRAFGHLHMWLKNLRINYVIPLVSSRTWLTIEFVLVMEGDFDEA